jgi:1,2-dihydroxy-3-keto-5-methylthiopentene dioxygenase
LDGEVIFGFVRPDGSQVQLLLRSQDFLHIPAGVEHWSGLSATLTLKAVRYFATSDSWIPQHTGTRLGHFLEQN